MTRTHAPWWAEAWQVLRRTFVDFYDKGGPLLSASLAFYTVLSMAPLALIAISVAGLAFGDEAATGELTAMLSRFIGEDVAQSASDVIVTVSDRGASRRATLVGFSLLVFGASRIFSEMENALNHLWRVTTDFPSWRAGVAKHLTKKLIAFSLVFIAGGFLTTLVLFSTITQVMSRAFAELPVQISWVSAAVVRVASGFLLTALFAVLYRWLPHATMAWRDVGRGALTAALLFTALEWPLSFYLSHQGIESSYGAVGGFVVFLLWVYYSAQIFFLGAQLARVLADRSGRGLQPDATATLLRDVPLP